MKRAFVSIFLFVALGLMTSFYLVDAGCEGKSSCGDCVKDVECYWCKENGKDGGNDTETCIKSWKPTGCDDFYVLTCNVDGVIWVSLAGAGAGLVLLFLICCIVYCCCCRGKAKRQRQFEMREKEDASRRRDMKDKQDSRRAERKAKNDAIRKKYGLYKDDDDNDGNNGDSPFSSTGTAGRYQRFD
ncbi:pituitary tumor-transforming gene 1 protein-interacting protein-like [Corticium candelabrum]|uniref:pituitary tumor-transforming gene 1 protein-interacting protein-like n=1 Tax=Corticium candelabrum TaxID=121492 RepID=UPI002E270B14|nr:pituitary tumor-transforming gene 1 protein-interacting protein-like [Corticium candelabrum]